MKRRTNKEIKDKIKEIEEERAKAIENEEWLGIVQKDTKLKYLYWVLGYCENCGFKLTNEERKKNWCIECHRRWAKGE